MSLIIGRLVAQLGVQDQGLAAGMQRAEQSMRQAESQAGRTGKSVSELAQAQAAASSRAAAALQRQALAEQKLADARRSGTASQQQLMRLEASAASARASAISSSSRLTSAQRQLSQANSAVASSFSGMTSQMKQQTEGMNGMTAAIVKTRTMLGALGITAGAAGTVKFFTDAIQNARALGAQTNQLNIFFGEGMSTIQNWAKGAVQAMSMSQRAAQGAALDFATFGSAAGLTGQKLAGFSMKLTEVAADAASFYAVTPQQMIEDMGSAFAGQSRPMQKYGVLLQENTLKQTAFNHGITDSIRDLSQTERIKTVYVAMLDQLAVTQGDVARTSEAFGNKLKRLQGRFEEVSAGIGQKMMPLAKAFVDLLAGPGLSVLAGFGSALGVVVKVLTTAGSAFAGLPAPIQAAVAAVVGLQLAQRLLGTQMATAGSHITGMANAVRNFSPIITSASDRMRGISAGMSGVVTTSRYGQVAIGQFGAQIQRIGNHVPIVARMQTAFMNAAVEANRFPRAAGAAAAGMTAVRGAASGLMGALGGPWGAAIMGATVLLGLFISQKQKDKQASQEAAAATASWSDQLVASGGKMTSALRNDIAKAVQDSSKKIQFAGNDTRKLADAMREVGISSKDAVDAISGNAEAWDRVRAKLKAYQEQHGQGRADMFVEDDMTKALAELGDQYGAATTRAAELAKVNRDTAVSFDNTAEAAGVMTTAMVEFEESTDGAASKVEKLVKALDQLNQDSQTQEEALQEWNDAIRDFTEQYEAAGAAVVDAGGNIDTTTKAGSELREKMEDQASAFNQVGAAAYEYAQSMGMDVASSLDYVRDKLVAQRKSFVDAAVGMGMPIEKANALADAYGMIPERIVTQLNVQGMEYALSGLNALGVKAQALPVGNLKIVENTSEVRAKLDEMKIKYAVIDGKVVIDTNSPEVIRAMEALGVKVETLPNGYVQLDDNSPAVMQKLNDLGIKTQTLPNGKIVINPEDAAFWEAVRKAQEPGQKNIVVNYVDSNGNTTARGLGSSGVPMSEEFLRKNRAVPQNATGGPIVGPGTKTSDSVLMWGSNGEFVQQASAVDYYGPGFMHALNQRQIPKSALPGFATGGLIEVHDLAQYVTGIESGTYGLGNWGDGWNTDCSGGQSIAVNAVHGNMQPGTGERAGTAAFSTFLPSHGYTIGTAPSGVAAHEVGWSIEHTAGTLYGKSGASVNFEMGGGMDNTTFSDGKYGGTVGSRHSQFSDHAYIILPDNYGAGSGGTPANADITLTADSSRDDVAKKIIAEGRKRGYTDEQITAVLSTGIQESNLDPKAQGGGGAWHGVFQQDESYDGRDDPNTNITGFYDKLDEKKKSEGWSEDMWSNIFWLQQAPGAESAEAAVANGRAEYLDEIKSKQSEAGTMLSTLGPSISTGSASEFPGGTGGTGTTDTTSSTTETEPPDDPTLFDFTIRNPFEPFWWKGEKKYRDHVIDEYKKQKEWDEYWSGTGSGGSSTAATASSIAAAESSLEEAKRNVAEATEKQRIAEMKLEEVKANPKSKPSQIASAEQSVVKAKNDVTQANEKQHTAELKLQELRAKGTTSTGKGTGRSGTGKSKGKTTSPSSPSQISAAESALEEAKRSLEEAKEKQRIAELKLQEVKANPKSKPSQVEAAELAVTKAKNDVTQATEKQRTAELKLQEVKSKGATVVHANTGGTVPGIGSTDIVPAMLTPGEEIIRKGVAERPGVRAFLKQLNAGQLQGLNGGGTAGFAGYADDDRDAMAPKNWYDWVGLGVGAGFSAYNSLEPYGQMLATGEVDLGNITPRISTNSTDTSYLSGVVGDLGGQISQQLEELIWAVKEGKDIHVTVTSESKPQGWNEPQLADMKFGG